MQTKQKIQTYVTKWLKPLGLLWWDVNVVYLDKPKELNDKEFFSDSGMILGKTHVNWQYGLATVYFNVPAFDEMKDEDIEEVVVHELVHILVNEMREPDMHHEERVVTGLTKAFLWTKEGLYGS